MVILQLIVELDLIGASKNQVVFEVKAKFNQKLIQQDTLTDQVVWNIVIKANSLDFFLIQIFVALSLHPGNASIAKIH